jgi:hypothetical protein
MYLEQHERRSNRDEQLRFPVLKVTYRTYSVSRLGKKPSNLVSWLLLMYLSVQTHIDVIDSELTDSSMVVSWL